LTDRPQQPPTPDEPDRVVVRDKRRIDPVTGEPRHAAAPSTPADPADPAGEAGQAPMVEASLLDERTNDLKRVQAEYANYRKRADRDKLAAGDVAISRVLAELLPVLDDIDRARSHDDLTGALKAVADHLEGIFGKLGLQAFGEVGDPFDPAIHEAVLHSDSDDFSLPTCTTVMRQGYQYGQRLLRPAMVGVTEPATTPIPPITDSPTPSTAGTTSTTEPAGDPSAGDTDPTAQREPEAKDE
jgi:molecular chaperone GrpE